MSRMIFFNIGWMKRYQGIADDDRPQGGGKFVDQNAWDYSMLNFKTYAGRYYGYGEPGSKFVNIGRLGARPEEDRLEGVTVIWVSRSPVHGPVIVGWYKNATLYRECQDPPQGSGREYEGTSIGFFACASVDDGVLLPEEERKFPIPRGKGGMGQSNVWYADQPEHEDFKGRVMQYIDSSGREIPEQMRNTWIFQANPALYDIQSALAELKELRWMVSAYKERITPDDEVFLWKSGAEAGIIGVGTVLTAPTTMGPDEEGLKFALQLEKFNTEQLRVRVRIDQVVSPPLLKAVLAEDTRLSKLSILTFSQGTNFAVSPGEAAAIHDLLENRPPEPAEAAARNLGDSDDIPGGADERVVPAESRIWAYAPGKNALKWEEFYRDGIMAIGWQALGNLRQYPDLDSTSQALVDVYKLDHRPVNDSNACYEFAHVMKPGDKVIVKRGRDEVVGYGTVTGDYRFVPSVGEYPNERSVRWERRGNWKCNRLLLPVKTLTDLTDYSETVRYLMELIGVAETAAVIVSDPAVPPYTIDDALGGVAFERERFSAMLATWRQKKNLILTGPPGVGKTFLARRLAYALIGHELPSRLGFVQFHQSYSYEDFIQGYRPSANGFERKDGVFVRFCKRASLDQDAIYVFIIDEINRSNLSKVFGELLMLIEADKRGSPHSLALTYSSSDEEQFYVPPNVFVLGMMNTADRSLAMVDYALRRRFAFENLEPLFGTAPLTDFLIGQGAAPAFVDEVSVRLEDLNKAISDDQNLGSGFCVGHSYFCTNGSAQEVEGYYRVIRHQILPLIQEYWFDDPDQVKKWATRLTAPFNL